MQRPAPSKILRSWSCKGHPSGASPSSFQRYKIAKASESAGHWYPDVSRTRESNHESGHGSNRQIMPGERNLQYFVETLPALDMTRGASQSRYAPSRSAKSEIGAYSEGFQLVVKCLCFSASCRSVRKPHLSLAFCFFSSASFRFAAFSSLTFTGRRAPWRQWQPCGDHITTSATRFKPLLSLPLLMQNSFVFLQSMAWRTFKGQWVSCIWVCLWVKSIIWNNHTNRMP